MSSTRQTRRQYTRDFKIAVVREIETGKSLAQVSRENGIHPSLIVKWKNEYFENPEKAFSGNGRVYKDQARMAELERLVGRLYAENEFLKKALRTLESRIQEERRRAVRE
jgi:transposase